MKIDFIDKWLFKIFVVLFSLLIALFLLTPRVSAVEWPLNKTQTCDLFNYTNSTTCDPYWCNNIQGGTYNTTREICVFNVNITTIFNVTTNTTTTTNQSLNSSQYWNITQIREYVLNETLFMRDAILGTNENRTRLLAQEEVAKIPLNSGTPQQSVSPLLIWVGLMGIIIIALFLGFLSWHGKKKEKEEELSIEELSSHKSPYKTKPQKEKKSPPTKKEIENFEEGGEE